MADDQKDFSSKVLKGLVQKLFREEGLLGKDGVLHDMCGVKSQKEKHVLKGETDWKFHSVCKG